MSHATRNRKLPAPRCPSRLKAQVMVSMTPEERGTLESISEQEMRSLSATTRMLLLKGLRQYQAETDSRVE